MAISEVDRISAQNQLACAEARTPSSTSSLPMKPDSGGMPVMAIAATKNSPPTSPPWAMRGAAAKRSRWAPRRSATRSATRKSAPAASVEWIR